MFRTLDLFRGWHSSSSASDSYSTAKEMHNDFCIADDIHGERLARLRVVVFTLYHSVEVRLAPFSLEVHGEPVGYFVLENFRVK